MQTRRTILRAIAAICGGTLVGACDLRQKRPPPRRVALGYVTEFSAPLTPRPLERVVIRRDAGGLSAMSLVCTHQTCLVTTPTLNNTNQELLCPCHGSRFSAEGKVLAGPARRDLPHFELEIDTDKKIWIQLGKEVTADWRLADV